MKNIIPFKKDVIFKTNLSEITSISLENSLTIKNDTVSGEFIINGEYKISDRSTSVEPFDIKLPFEIVIDEKYDSSKAIVDIDDFYYEIVNNNVLSISIDVLIDKLQEKPLIEIEDLVEVTPVRETLEIKEDEDDTMDSQDVRELFEKDSEVKTNNEEIREEKKQEEVKKDIESSNRENITGKSDTVVEEKINSIFNQFSKDSEVYVTYNVFILRDGDTIDTILEKYNITLEELQKYNDLSNLQLGDKIIIPCSNERD